MDNIHVSEKAYKTQAFPSFTKGFYKKIHIHVSQCTMYMHVTF